MNIVRSINMLKFTSKSIVFETNWVICLQSIHFFVKQGIFKLLRIICCLTELAPNLEILSIFIRSLFSREVSVAEDNQKLIAWDKSGAYLDLVNIRLFKHSSNHVLLY